MTRFRTPLRWSSLGLLGALCLLAALLAAGPAPAQVVVNEILADPASDWDGDGAVDSRGDEWVEVLNTGPEPVDLADWWLQDEAADTPRLRLSGTLAPGAVAVFYGSDADAWQDATGLSSGGLSLNNAGDTVILGRTVAGSDPVAVEPVDTVAYPDHAAEDDRACGWDTHRTAWVLYDELLPYGGALDPPGTGCPPTPGQENLCHGEVADERISFGDVKARFR